MGTNETFRSYAIELIALKKTADERIKVLKKMADLINENSDENLIKFFCTNLETAVYKTGEYEGISSVQKLCAAALEINNGKNHHILKTEIIKTLKWYA